MWSEKFIFYLLSTKVRFILGTFRSIKSSKSLSDRHKLFCYFITVGAASQWWSNDCLLQAYDGKMLVNDGEMLVNDGKKYVYDHTLISPSLTSIALSLTCILPSLAWSIPSFTHLTIIEELHRLYSLRQNYCRANLQFLQLSLWYAPVFGMVILKWKIMQKKHSSYILLSIRRIRGWWIFCVEFYL